MCKSKCFKSLCVSMTCRAVLAGDSILLKGLPRPDRSNGGSETKYCGNKTSCKTLNLGCLKRRMQAAQSIRTRDNVAHSQVNHHQLLLDKWNILTLTGKELELVKKAKRYHLDIVVVSSTQRRGSGSGGSRKFWWGGF